MRAELDRAAFDPAHVFHAGSQTNQARIQAGEYQIVTLGFQTNVAGWRVERVLGVEPLRQFLTATAGGRWQTQEASYDPRSNVWFDVFGNDDRQPGEWGHWTGRGMNWNSMCAACHNTGLSKNYEAATDSYHTTMDEMAVGCGACHGSLAEHMDWQRAHPGGHGKDPTVTPLSPARMLGVCGSCHSRREEVAGGFTPGDSYFDHYEMETVDETDNWFADGQVRSEDYEFASFLGSKMRQRGVTCLDCHNPHSMKLLLPGNDLCLRCHSGAMTNAPVIVPIAHSHHAASSAGNQCVGCHMPVTVYMQRHARHDHGLTIPDPLLTKEWNVPNACNRCHADKSASWALDSTAQWYGEKMNRPTRDRARLIAAAQRGKESARTPLTRMTGAAGESPYWRAVAAGLLWRWTDNAAVQAALLASLKDEHPLVRAKAVKSLEPLADEEDRAVVAALQPLLEDPVRTVRLAAAWALKSSLDPGSGAGRELSAMLELNGDQPAGQYRLAQFAMARKQPADAAARLRLAVKWDPFSPPLRSALAQVLSQLELTNEAAGELRELCRLEPDSGDDRFQLGLALAEAGQKDAALQALQEAVKLDPEHARAWYNLGVAWSAAGQIDKSLEALARAAALAPADPQIPCARAQILAHAGRFDEARLAAQQALRIRSDYPPAQDLLRRLDDGQP